MRILLDFDKNVYSDFPVLFARSRRSDNGIILHGNDKAEYELRYPISESKSRHFPELLKSEYLYEVNAITGLMHEYYVIKDCKFYRNGCLINNNVSFILFERTVIPEDEYAEYVQSNWSMDKWRFDPIEMEVR